MNNKDRAKHHKTNVYRAVIKHLNECDICKLDNKKFTFKESCEVGNVLHEEYLIARTYLNS